LIGKNVWKEFPDAVGSATYHSFHQAMREQKYICHTDYYERLNLWMENHIYPSSEGISVFIRDISERKKAEKKLIESIESHERAEEQAKMGSWLLEVGTGKRTWSKQLFLMFGFEPAQQPPEFDEFLNRIHPEDRSEVIMSLEKMRQGIAPGEFIIRTNPVLLPLRYLLRYTRKVADQNGKAISFEGTMLDITELQKTNKELDHFVYSVSHDLRAPVATILGLINIAEMENPNAAMTSYLKTIRDHVNRLDGFIKDILDYSLNARTEITKEKIDFYSLVEDVKERIGLFTKTERLYVELEIKNVAEFYSDRLRLEIILNNLLSNSIKYQDYSKDLCLVKIQISFSENHVEIIYSDNGIGIEATHLGKIFNMFYRASHNSKGSGLGLYIVKEAVSKLGGTISAQSNYGESTTFKLVLPIKTKE
jgi:signal transduction histidine kinase